MNAPSIRLVDVYQDGQATTGVLEWLYELVASRLQEPNVNISHRETPSFEQHHAFVASRPYRCWYIIETLEHERVGYVSATPRNELGVVIHLEHRRRGYARTALRMLITAHDPLPAMPGKRLGAWVANINPANEPSLALFRGLGGQVVQVTMRLPSP